MLRNAMGWECVCVCFLGGKLTEVYGSTLLRYEWVGGDQISRKRALLEGPLGYLGVYSG